MAAGTFAGFARAQSRTVTLLVELTPGLKLSNWAKTGGRTFVYQVTLSRFEAGGSGTRFGSGLYRKCVGLSENQTALQAVADVATCDSTASSYFWDEANGILYTHSSTGADPDTFTLFMALMRFYLASDGAVLDQTPADANTGVYYQPWLTPDSRNDIAEQMSDALSGITVTATADLSLTNGHGWFHPIIATDGPYVWKNKRVQILIGGSYDGIYVLPKSEYAAWSTLLVDDVAADEERALFTLKPLKGITEREVPVTPYFTDAYPNLGSGVMGSHKPIVYGRNTVRPDLTDIAADGVYTLADAAYQTLFAVNSVVAINRATQVRTTLALGTDYTVNLTACTLTIINAAYEWQSHDLDVDLTGKPDGAGSYYKTFSAIARDLLQTFLSVLDDDLEESFPQAALDAPQELAVYLKVPRAIASILNASQDGAPSLEKSVMGTVQQTLSGRWTCWIWKPGYDPATAIALRKQDFVRFSAQPKLETIYSATQVFFSHAPATDTWQTQTSTDLKTQYSTGLADTLKIYTYLRNQSDALVLAQRYQVISGSVSLEIEFEERGALLAKSVAGDKVLVTFYPAPVAAGQMIDYPMELLQIDRSLVPVLRMAGRLGDLRGIGAKVGHWVAGGSPNWASASASQRASSGFWADSAGLIDPSDQATKNIRIWW